MSEIKPAQNRINEWVEANEHQLKEFFNADNIQHHKNKFLSDENSELRAALSSLEMKLASQEAKLESHVSVNEQLAKRIAHQQYLIDSLMIEYCPDEMTEEQWENWKAHQRKAEL